VVRGDHVIRAWRIGWSLCEMRCMVCEKHRDFTWCTWQHSCRAVQGAGVRSARSACAATSLRKQERFAGQKGTGVSTLPGARLWALRLCGMGPVLRSAVRAPTHSLWCAHGAASWPCYCMGCPHFTAPPCISESDSPLPVLPPPTAISGTIAPPSPPYARGVPRAVLDLFCPAASPYPAPSHSNSPTHCPPFPPCTAISGITVPPSPPYVPIAPS
jgi:hypothetical protein